MKNLYKKNQGLTLIEIMVVVGILIIVISFGVIVDFSSFTSSAFQTEESKIISVLQRARSRSMANMFDITHGVCYIAPNYVIFQGNTCAAGEIVPANINIASHSSTVFPTVVFEQLTGNRNTPNDTIHITDSVKSADIIINDEGTINW